MMNPYALLDVFTLDEAVQAITGIVQPKTTEDKNQVELVVMALRGDIDSGKLNATVTQAQRVRQERIGMRRISINDTRDHRPIVEHPYTETIIRIARAELMAWCEARGIRPELLFPDPSQDEKRLHANERNTLLAIIRTLAELHGIKSGGGAYRKVAASLLLDIANAAIEAPCDEKSLAKHLSASFKVR
ncbi:MAG: hypothetical protein H6972_13155 [Gammaproteobacteria bacterium]|nr:hypothetical protein [Gammaproteobacteria bacterium]